MGDLHCHTRLSNGSMGLDDIMALAKKKGVEVLSITDHDCQAANVRAKVIGERVGIKVIPGAEFSAIDEESGEVIHILCYLAEYPDRLEGLCRRNSLATRRASQYMFSRALKLFPISDEVVKRCANGSTSLYAQHIMHALMECGITDGIYSDLYKELFTPESEKNILEKPKYASAREVIDAIHEAEGVAILAHPMRYTDETIVERMVSCGLDGIEVWHPSATPAQSEALAAFAKKKKILMTGGSDFRGMYNEQPLSPGDYRTPEAQLNELFGFKAKQKRLAKKKAEQEKEGS